MKSLYAILFFLTGITFQAFTQNKLTNSRQSGVYSYLYKISDERVERLYRRNKLDENILTSPVDSFLTTIGRMPALPPGNYIKVVAVGNSLEYQLIEKPSAYFQLLDNRKDLQFILLDREGKEIKNAKVSIGKKQVAFDQKSQLWLAKQPAPDSTLVKIEYEGIANFTWITRQSYKRKHKVESWLLKNTPLKYTYPVVIRTAYKIVGKYPPVRYRNFRSKKNSKSKDEAGYMVFSKPKYKLSDTVKLKAFIVKGRKHKPVKTPLQLVLRNEAKEIKMGIINPSVPGSFDFSFALHDSLQLKLDKQYYMALKKGQNIYQGGYFRLEDYELQASQFSFRPARKTHSKDQQQSLYFSATDENGLNVADGRVEVIVRKSYISNYYAKTVFVPDTIWHHKLNLDAVGETRVDIPSDVFPEADLNYEIEAVFLNSNNEKKTERASVQLKKALSPINFELKADSLHLTVAENSSIKSYSASLYQLSITGDTLRKSPVQIPSVIRIDPIVSEYLLKSDSFSASFDPGSSSSGIQITGSRSKDSLFVQVINARNIPFWFTILKGNKVFDRGSSCGDLSYNRRCNTRDNVRVIVNYIWDGKQGSANKDIQFLEKQLNLNVNQPLVIVPGQKATLEVKVTDAKGKPVKDADLTAYSVTSKFNPVAPDVPYLGKGYLMAKQKLVLNQGSKGTYGAGSLRLNWERWAKSMGLDSIEYFRFTHPEPLYRLEETAPDSLTQLVPFVVENGSLLPVHILFIDEKPVYFNQAEQLERYAFPLSPGEHKLRFRLADREITAEKVDARKGMRTIVSINVNQDQNKNIRVDKKTPFLSEAEANQLNKYMIRVQDGYSPNMSKIEALDKLYLLPETNSTKLIGPLPWDFLHYVPFNGPSVYFDAEPNFSFEFRPGLIKQKSIREKYPFSTWLASTRVASFKDKVLTSSEADSIWREYIDLRCFTNQIVYNERRVIKRPGQLLLGAPESEQKPLPMIKHVLLYSADDPGFLNMYPGNQKDLGRLEEGTYRLMLLLKNDSYILMQPVVVKAYGTNFITADFEKILPKDSVSIRIAKILYDKALAGYSRETVTAELIRNNFNEQYVHESKFANTITGKVVDSKDIPLPGVSVRVKGTKSGGITSVDGIFRIKAPASGTLVFNYLGFNTREVSIDLSSDLRVVLEESSSSLQEVVVVGYGVQKRANLTGAVTTLSGVVEGVETIRIRGTASLSANAKPLVIVDGVIHEGDADDFSPESISSVSVLKDASAAALYGARAANGVVVITTKKGNVPGDTNGDPLQAGGKSIRSNFSDNAFWQPRLRTDANGKASFNVTFPDDITNWKTFFIAMNGKEQSGFTEGSIKAFKPVSANFVSPLFAVEGDEFYPLGKVLNYTSESISLNRSFSYNDRSILKGMVNVKNAVIDTFKVVAGGRDSLKFEYTIEKQDAYSDGEVRKIPLFKAGVLESTGFFNVLDGDTTVTLQFNPALGPVTLRAEASVLPVLLEETERLRTYEYLCNEQLASKLKALLVQKRIKNHLNESFTYDKNIRQLIKKLQDTRHSNGLWGWWHSSDSEMWISKHVIESLLEAEKEGYKIAINKEQIIAGLVQEVSRSRGMNKLEALQILKKLDAKVDYQTPLELYEKEQKGKPDASLHEKLQLWYFKQQLGIHVPMDSLMKYGHRTMLGNLYFGEQSYLFFNNSVQNSLLAYRLLKKQGSSESLLKSLRYYFLEQRRTNSWRNTYETALILETILPDMMKNGSEPGKSSLSIKGAVNQIVTEFPFTVTADENTSVTVDKRGDLPVYFSGYQQYWNADPKRVEKNFTVTTSFENKEGKPLSRLKGGESVFLKAEVKVTGDAEFVMIEIPVPAGCSYEEKSQQWWGNEVHREYFKNKVSIFCRKLPKGNFTFKVKLLPRYSGNFNLNPAKAEMMYFPIFYGREGMKKVKVD